MDIDFIKWVCEKAEVFVIDKTEDLGEWVACPDGTDCFLLKRLPLSRDARRKWNDVYYPLLLQRAIEGVNRRYFCEGSKAYPWLVLNNSHGYLVYCGPKSTPENRYLYDFPCESKDIDTAKESALRYIYEQEKNSEN